ncbi:MAG: ABC-F family ATP-binding cassette domain-containing protein [Anaerolineales bacterium]|nr:ABC-F family ATP-binding cassette domain-containing protein [Anaerolineales bacterium]
MLHVNLLSKGYFEPLFENVTFHIHRGERMGLIGPNGCGKTTLMRILMGEEAADSGTFSFSPPDLSIGYLSQGFQYRDLRVEEFLHSDLIHIQKLEEEMGVIAGTLFSLAGGRRTAMEERYEEILRELNVLSARSKEYRADEILKDFDLAVIDPKTRVEELSGGQKTRLGLAKILTDKPQLLLLDEPTNHLDIHMLEWLEDWLNDYDCAALIVSHDRMFLQRTVSGILDMDPETRTVRAFDGSYSDYLSRKSVEQKRALSSFQDQEAEIRRLKQDIARIKQQAQTTERSTQNDVQRRYAKKVARKATAREKKLQRYMESEDHLEKPKAGWQMKLSFSKPEHIGKRALVVENLAVGYAGQPSILEGINMDLKAGDRVVLSGPNGCGKSTLLKTIIGELEPVCGRVLHGGGMRMGYMAQEQQNPDPEQTVLEVIRQRKAASDTELRSFLHFFLFSGEDPLRKVHQLSYGERVRLMLASLVAEGCTFLLLDEPINHLDIPSRECFEQALDQFEGTVLAVVHDRMFISRYANRILRIEEGLIREITAYEL